jgi:hypothetical protein
VIRLPRFASVLRRLFPGKDPRIVLSRRALCRVAEHRASKPDATPKTVLERLVYVRSKLTDEQKLQMRLALERDLCLDEGPAARERNKEAVGHIMAAKEEAIAALGPSDRLVQKFDDVIAELSNLPPLGPGREGSS